MMAYNTFTSSLNFSSSTPESSHYSSPCSSPSSLPQPPPQYVCKLSVPFLWEEKPGITKTSPSSPINIFYGSSLELPPLPPPPCLSPAFLSPARSKASKLLAAHYLISRRPHEAKPSKEQHQEDPFFLALKACTKVDNKCRRDVSKASFDGALSIFKHTKKGQKSMECKRGDSKKNYEDSDHHQTRREVSFNLHQTRREMSFNGEGNRRGKLVATSTHGALHDLYSIEERASRVETRREMGFNGEGNRRGKLVATTHGGLHELYSIEERASRAETRWSNSRKLMLEKDEESTNSMAKRAHNHMNAGGKALSNGFLKDVGVANKAKMDEPLQGLHTKASRREHLNGGEVGGHRKPKLNGRGHLIGGEVGGHRKPKHSNDGRVYSGREINDALDRINEGHSKAKQSGPGAKVVEFNSCGGYLRNSDNKHHASKPNMFTDMLGCKALNGAAIHPSLHFHNKLFSAHH